MKKIKSIALRYSLVLILGLSNFYIISKILSPLTIHTTNAILNIFTSTTLIADTIQLASTKIQIAPSCVAASAYYLLIFLLLATPTKTKTLTKALATAIISLFILNVTRILLLIPVISSPNFESIHWITWHIISIILVVGIYITTIKFYKIKTIPIYTDFKYLIKIIKRSNHPRP